MSAIAKDINRRLVVVRSRLLTRNAPITREFPNTIIKARTQKNTVATMSTSRGGPGGGPVLFVLFVPLILFVRFVNVVFIFSSRNLPQQFPLVH